MQTATAWKQLNNIPETSVYIEFPLAFTGKKRKGKATVFSGLSLSVQFILAYIHTMNNIYKEPAKLTYEHFIELYGMSRETVCAGLKLLIKLGIIERVKQSRYKIIAKYNRKNYVEIDVYWLKREWEINGKKKRLARSRFLNLALLKRSVTNPKTDGVFISSQERIGKAVNLPRTTVGDALRELTAASLINSEKQDGNDKRKRGCSLFKVNPRILEVKHPYLNLQAVQAFFKEPTAEELHARLMRKNEYKNLIERINSNHSAIVTEIFRTRGADSPELGRLESEKEELREELENYFKTCKIKRSVFPPGFFLTDIINEEAI